MTNVPLWFSQCKTLELKLEEERVFTEYEQILKKRVDCVLATATLPENVERNRFRDVVPYEENRVELVPNKENNTGYINASHIKVLQIRSHGILGTLLFIPLFFSDNI